MLSMFVVYNLCVYCVSYAYKYVMEVMCVGALCMYEVCVCFVCMLCALCMYV